MDMKQTYSETKLIRSAINADDEILSRGRR
jgi:hypothetical protein